MVPAERNKLIHLLDELANSVEDLLLSGMTAASKTTRDKLAVGFKEASRMRLLRLGSTLRIATEEMRRFDAGDEAFSATRLSFFLGRAWMLSSSMANALRREDLEAFGEMNRTPPTVSLKQVDFVVIGVLKRHVKGAFTAFEMRAVLLADAGPLQAGDGVVLPFIFPDNKNLPPEAYLVLEQKQKFKPADLLLRRRIRMTRCMLATGNPKRLVVRPETRVQLGGAFEDWQSVLQWDRKGAVTRIGEHEPDPLTLPVELQEVVVLHDWQLGKFKPSGEGYDRANLQGEGLEWQVRADTSKHGDSTRKGLRQAAAARTRPALVGLVHYEMCELVLHPLGLVSRDRGPAYLNVAEANIDKAALIRALNLT